jgi:hypothetical protein
MAGTATAVTNTAQLDIFQTLRDVLLNNSTLSTKFKKINFYEFEPNLDSISFDMLPYIVIQPPSTETDLLVIDHNCNLKSFTVNLILVMAWEARKLRNSDGTVDDGGNFRKFANAIIRQIEAEDSTLQDQGYQNARVNLIDTSVDLIQGKQSVTGQFEVIFDGYTGR